MKFRANPLLLLGAALLLPGCAAVESRGIQPRRSAENADPPEFRALTFTPELEEKILALDPEHVSEKDVREVLSRAPAPRIVNIHGGIFPVYLMMVSFSEFLVAMGYPASSVGNPDGTYSYSCYEDSAMIAGVVAWYYEKEGMRPMIIGHSQGGMQTIKVLRQLAGDYSMHVAVWNPVTGRSERRYQIVDPFTGQQRPVVGLQVCYATAEGAGGITRLLPNQWDMEFSLRQVPDTVEDFTGFYQKFDLLGGDFLGFGPANLFHAAGKAVVRNVELPASYGHAAIPDTRRLADSQEVRDWINNYTPALHPKSDPKLNGDTRHILWAADVWYSIKKHWVLELQRVIRAKRALAHAS